MNRELPTCYRYYKVTVCGSKCWVGPFDVISKNTVESTPVVLESANKKFPGDGLDTAETIWVEATDPPASLLTDFFQMYDEAMEKANVTH